MSSLVFGGHDFTPYCRAEVLYPGAHAVEVDTVTVPGRAGAVIAGSTVSPQRIVLQLFLTCGARMSSDELAQLRHTLLSWLLACDGTELVLPGDDALRYKDVMCVDASTWDELFVDGSCEVAFVAYDPIAFGEDVTVSTATFDVGGTWRTWPRFEGVAIAGTAVSVGNIALGYAVEIAHTFAGGEEVVVDCGQGMVWIDGEDARDCVSLESDFFWLVPGACELDIEGLVGPTCSFAERWA